MVSDFRGDRLDLGHYDLHHIIVLNQFLSVLFVVARLRYCLQYELLTERVSVLKLGPENHKQLLLLKQQVYNFLVLSQNLKSQSGFIHDQGGISCQYLLDKDLNGVLMVLNDLFHPVNVEISILIELLLSGYLCLFQNGHNGLMVLNQLSWVLNFQDGFLSALVLNQCVEQFQSEQCYLVVVFVLNKRYYQWPKQYFDYSRMLLRYNNMNGFVRRLQSLQ